MRPTAKSREEGNRSRPGRLLGDVIVGLGYCSREEVEAAVDIGRAEGRQLGQVLLERETLTADELAGAIADRFGLQYVNLQEFEPDMAALNLAPVQAVRRLNAVPIAFRDEETLLVAMANPTNVLALDDMAMLTDMRVEPVVVSHADLEALLGRLSRIDDDMLDVGEPGDDEDPENDDPFREASDDDAPTIKLVRSIVAQAIEQGASDIHFDPDDGDLLVRYRIDGIMSDATRIPRRQAARVISRIKILSNLDISERRLPQDGRTSMALMGRRIDIRVTIVPLVAGESAVLRVLDPGGEPLSLTQLGMDELDRATVELALASSHGAILATGPTGSGKSTTLYAAVSVVASPEKTLMTIEDPVEYRVPGIKQMQVHERAGLTFSTGLRSIVRADPDVIMVGEMRDRESARIAIEAALTGHLVLSTLHTNNAPAAAARLVDMGVEPYLVASAIDCVIAQRLARKLCMSCRRAVKVDATHVGGRGARKVEVFEPVGCARCRDQGYRGRVGLFEVMSVSEEIRGLIVQRAPAGDIGRLAISQGMRTLREHGLAKVLAGDTSLAEVARVTG